RHLAGVLDRRRDVALMLDAVARDPAGPDLAPVGHELPEAPHVLVVDVGHLVLAEHTELLLLLLLPGLVVLLLALPRSLLLCSRHPVASPLAVRPRRRSRCPTSRTLHRNGPAARASRSPTASWVRPRRLRSRPCSCARPRPSPTSSCEAGRPRPPAFPG